MRSQTTNPELRKLNLLTVMAVLFVFTFTSCKKEEEAISNEEAADLISYAVLPESGGMVEQVEIVLTYASGTTDTCSTQYNATYTGANVPGAVIEYSYSLVYQGELLCNGSSEPESYSFAVAGANEYDAPRMASDDSFEASYSVTGLSSSSNEYTFNYSFDRVGSQTSRIRNRNSFASTIQLQTTDLKVSKTTGLITSGTATVVATGSVSSGGSFNYNGTITFLGNQTATLVVDGVSYSLVW